MMKFTKTEIRKVLKHRDPFLLVDSIEYFSSDYVEGTYEVLENNLFLQGHFPGDPIVPGVILVESMAQVAGFLMAYNLMDLRQEHAPKDDYDFFLSKISFVKFKSKVIPPALLRITAKIRPALMDNFCEAIGQVYLGDQLKATGNLLLYMGLKNRD